MTRFEKTVKKGLECCAAGECVKSECPYYGAADDLDPEICCNTVLARDALKLIKKLNLELLKDREPAKGEKAIRYGMTFWICNACDTIITEHDKFCRECGRAVKWDE